MGDSQFDLFAACTARDDGIGPIRKDGRWLIDMRRFALSCIRHKGKVTADDVRRHAATTRNHPTSSCAYGAIFRSKEFHRVGYMQSRYISNHARVIGIWAFKSSN